jgi:hypothetical protein
MYQYELHINTIYHLPSIPRLCFEGSTLSSYGWPIVGTTCVELMRSSPGVSCKTTSAKSSWMVVLRGRPHYICKLEGTCTPSLGCITNTMVQWYHSKLQEDYSSSLPFDDVYSLESSRGLLTGPYCGPRRLVRIRCRCDSVQVHQNPRVSALVCSWERCL